MSEEPIRYPNTLGTYPERIVTHYSTESKQAATPYRRIAALEADVARLQWQVAKLLAKPTRRKKRK